MRRDNCQLAEHEAWFKGKCCKHTLEPGLIVIDPVTDPLRYPDSSPWRSSFAIIYPDEMYIRIAEYYRQLSRSEGGGGCLEILAYHYGPCTDARDDKGFPVFSEEFELRPDKPGFANRCPSCSEPEETGPSYAPQSAEERQAEAEANEARRKAIRDLLYRGDS